MSLTKRDDSIHRKWNCTSLATREMSSKIGVLERRTSSGSEEFSLLICLDAIQFELLSWFTLVETIWQKILAKPLPRNVKSHFRLTRVAQKRLCLIKFPSAEIRTVDKQLTYYERSEHWRRRGKTSEYAVNFGKLCFHWTCYGLTTTLAPHVNLQDGKKTYDNNICLLEQAKENAYRKI